MADAVTILGFLFGGLPVPPCHDASDSNDDGKINVADAIYTLGFLFGSGPTPLPPFETCGEDPTEDSLNCTLFTPCN